MIERPPATPECLACFYLCDCEVSQNHLLLSVRCVGVQVRPIHELKSASKGTDPRFFDLPEDGSPPLRRNLSSDDILFLASLRC